MEKFDFRKYKYVLATVFILIIFIMLVSNAYKYLPKQNEINSLNNNPTIETEQNYTSSIEVNEEETSNKEEERIENPQIEEKFANFFDEEEKNIDFDTTERFKELSDDELE